MSFQITDESDFLKGAVVLQAVNLFGIFIYFGYRRQPTYDESIEIQKVILTRADEIKKVILNAGI